MREENYWTGAMRRRLSRRQAIKVGALTGVGLAAGSILGCSTQESKPSTNGGSTSPTSGGSTPPAASGPKRGGTLRYNLTADPPHWDVHTTDVSTVMGPAQFVYSGLLKLDEKRSQDLLTEYVIVNDLAESYEQPQPNVFVFKLRKGVKFHNKPPVNGRELTAEDIKYSIDRIRSPEPQFIRRSMFEDVDKIETPDKYTVKFTLKKPSVPFLFSIASPWTLMVAKEVVDKDGDLKKTLIGTGPFLADEFTRNVSYRFKRNPDYFIKDSPYLDGVDVKIIPDSSTSLAALRAKELDIGGVAYSQLDNFKKTNPDAEIVKVGSSGKCTAAFRLDRQPFSDVRVRKALQAATDYQEFINIVALGQAKRDGPLQWWLKPYALEESDLPKTDLDKARQLLAEAGFPNGFKAQATVTPTFLGVTLGEIAVSQWKKIGVEIELKVLEWGAWANTVWSNKDFNLYFLLDWNYEDPDRWLYPYFHTKGSQNVFGYSNSKVDAWLEKERETFSVDERVKIFKDIQKQILDDVPYIPLYTSMSYWVRQPYVKEFDFYASYLLQYYFGGVKCWFDK